MKYFIVLFAILIAVGFLYWGYSLKSISTEIVLIKDITDSFRAEPDIEQIKELYGFEDNIWSSGVFRFVTITDVDYNKTYQNQIEAANKWLSNEFSRKKEIKDFIGEIEQILQKAESDMIGRDHSSVYGIISSELNRLSRGNAQKKIAVIYSDLMENSDFLSLYTKDHFTLLKTDPDSIERLFSEQVPLQYLSGVDIYIVFQPASYIQNQQFKIISESYRKLFEKKGATVSISANLVI